MTVNNWQVFNHGRLVGEFPTANSAAYEVLCLTGHVPDDGVLEVLPPSDLLNALQTRDKNPILQDWEVREVID